MQLGFLMDVLTFLSTVATRLWEWFSAPAFWIGLAATIIAAIVAKAIFS